MMGFPTFFFSAIKISLDVLDCAQQLFSNGYEGVELLNLLAGPLKSGENTGARGVSRRGCSVVVVLRAEYAQVNHS